MILNIYRIDQTNVGDLYCSPTRYFSELRGTESQCILEPLRCIPQTLILGGGGLLYFPNRMRRLCELDAVKVVWGIGANCHGSNQITHPSFLEACQLVGIRDYGYGHRWVPCASCLSPAFDSPPKPLHEIVVYEHAGYPLHLRLPTLRNSCMDFERVISFLATGDTVLTNSYHGVYWATLLGRKVITIPFSSKFYGFKHPPTISSLERWQTDVKQGRCYPEALDECRAANLAFSQDVFQLVESVSPS